MNNLNFNRNLALPYKSNSQAIRILTESWLSDNMYCPCCGNVVLKKFENNKPVADFYCEKCEEQFELKSSGKKIENKVRVFLDIESYRAKREKTLEELAGDKKYL